MRTLPLRRDVGFDIPLLPFPYRWILLLRQIPISSVAAQNPPVLLPPKSVSQPLSARTADGEVSPFPAPAGSKGIKKLDFPAENRVPTGMLLAPIGNPEPRGYSPLDIPCFHRLCIYKPALACIYHNPTCLQV